MPVKCLAICRCLDPFAVRFQRGMELVDGGVITDQMFYKRDGFKGDWAQRIASTCPEMAHINIVTVCSNASEGQLLSDHQDQMRQGVVGHLIRQVLVAANQDSL